MECLMTPIEKAGVHPVSGVDERSGSRSFRGSGRIKPVMHDGGGQETGDNLEDQRQSNW